MYTKKSNKQNKISLVMTIFLSLIFVFGLSGCSRSNKKDDVVQLFNQDDILNADSEDESGTDGFDEAGDASEVEETEPAVEMIAFEKRGGYQDYKKLEPEMKKLISVLADLKTLDDANELYNLMNEMEFPWQHTGEDAADDAVSDYSLFTVCNGYKIAVSCMVYEDGERAFSVEVRAEKGQGYVFTVQNDSVWFVNSDCVNWKWEGTGDGYVMKVGEWEPQHYYSLYSGDDVYW